MTPKHGRDPRVSGDHYRDEDGTFRRENGNKLIGTLEDEYGVKTPFRRDKKLENALKETGMASQTQLLKNLSKLKQR